MVVEDMNNSEEHLGLIHDFLDVIPKRLYWDHFDRSFCDFETRFTAKLTTDPEGTLLGIYRFLIWQAFLLYIRSAFVMQFLMLDWDSRSNGREDSGRLPSEATKTWLPRIEKQQQMLLALMDAYTRAVGRLEAAQRRTKDKAGELGGEDRAEAP